MDGSAGAEEEGIPQEPTVASILGIHGPLRFRTHGSTQKAHVVLRQIDLSDESGDEGDDPNMVYFSLFAQKRIEVKPGKEILLAIASPDGRFIDTPVIFAGSLVEPKVEEKVEAPVQPPVEVVPAKPAVYTMPPRMRKAWPPGQSDVGQTGSGLPSEYTLPIISTPEILMHVEDFPSSKSVSFTSVGIQCEIPTTSRAVETEPEPVKLVASSGVQAEEPPILTHAKDTQTETPVVSYQDGETQTVIEVQPIPVAAPVAKVPAASGHGRKTHAEDRERSLSPMELDSPPSSPTLSPTVEPVKQVTPPPRERSLSYSPRTFSPPQLSISTTDTSQSLATSEARISPMHLSPVGGDAPGLMITPEVLEFHRTFTPPVDRSNLHLPPPKEPAQGKKVSPQASISPPSQLPPPLERVPSASLSSVPPTPSTPSTPTVTPGAPSEPSRSESEPTPYVPKRKAVPNPFVSGGYLNDFVSTTTKTSATPIPSPLPPSPKASSLPPSNVSLSSYIIAQILTSAFVATRSIIFSCAYDLLI